MFNLLIKRYLYIEDLNLNICLSYPIIFSGCFQSYFGKHLFINNYRVTDLHYIFSFFNLSSTLKKKYIYINLYQLFRAFIRSIYKNLFIGVNVMGVFEYIVYLIRNHILIDLEQLLIENGYSLLHGAVLTNNTNTILLLGRSKTGKTSYSFLLEQIGWKCLSDNYVFVNGNKFLTLPECRRYGKAKRFKTSFYTKNVEGSFNGSSGFFTSIYILSLNNSNFSKLYKIKKESALNMIKSIMIEESEGIISIDKIKYLNCLNISTKKIICNFYCFEHSFNIKIATIMLKKIGNQI